MAELYVGLMSGTSVDGIDAAIVDFSSSNPILIGTHYTPYEKNIRDQILALCVPGENEIQRMGEMDRLLGEKFARSTQELLAKYNIDSATVQAIGSHGQTIRHYPTQALPFTLQIGDPNVIAALTGVTTIADFRRRDVALGGQGAPLVPAFHQAVFGDAKINRVIVNIGGIANITLLPASLQSVIGFDTGPGNVLLDAWISEHLQINHDHHGQWAASGQIQQTLLQAMLADDYFQLAAPKSCGREYFNLAWIKQKIAETSLQTKPEDVQATLVELTTITILNHIKKYLTQGEIILCGGGTHNVFLMQRINAHARNDFKVMTTASLGIDPDWVEAVAFAWLAFQTHNKRHGNLPSVTGAKKTSVLGGIYFS